MNNKLERSSHNLITVLSQHFTGGTDFNLGTPEYAAVVLTTRPQCLASSNIVSTSNQLINHNEWQGKWNRIPCIAVFFTNDTWIN
jgi:hypothetical protein